MNNKVAKSDTSRSGTASGKRWEQWRRSYIGFYKRYMSNERENNVGTLLLNPMNDSKIALCFSPSSDI